MSEIFSMRFLGIGKEFSGQISLTVSEKFSEFVAIEFLYTIGHL